MTGFPKPKRPERISAKEFRQAWKRTFGRPGGKYGIKTVESRDGRTLRSGLEREYLDQELRPREMAGEIRDIEIEPQQYFEINGIRILGYKPDFKYFDVRLGMVVWDECKGEATDKDKLWAVKQNLWRAMGPGPLRVIKGDKNGWRCVRIIHPVATMEETKQCA